LFVIQSFYDREKREWNDFYTGFTRVGQGRVVMMRRFYSLRGGFDSCFLWGSLLRLAAVVITPRRTGGYGKGLPPIFSSFFLLNCSYNPGICIYFISKPAYWTVAGQGEGSVRFSAEKPADFVTGFSGKVFWAKQIRKQGEAK